MSSKPHIRCNVIFVRQNGTSGDDEIRGLAVAEDGSVLLGGELDGDFAAAKLNATGAVVWDWKVTSMCDYTESQ